MALKDTSQGMKDLLGKMIKDLDKAVRGNKAAAQRVRVATVRLEKIGKLFRKESVLSEKKDLEKGRQSAKKTSTKKATAKVLKKRT